MVYRKHVYLLEAYLISFQCHLLLLFPRLPEPSLLLHTVLPDALVYFVNEHSFFIVTYNLSQEEFVGKVR